MLCKQIKISLFFIAITLYTTLFFGDCLESSLSRCCNVGVRWAWENKTCREYPGPVRGIPAEHQASCLSTINACCRRNYMERQCFKGHETAKAGNECIIGFGQGGHQHQDCCEGCKLGLVAGSMGLNCEFQSLKLALGPPWDNSITKCCLQAGGSGRYSPADRTSTDNLERSSSTPSERDEIIGQDVCSLFPGQLCSQICTPDGNSYQCSCQAGFTLLSDGKTCSPASERLREPVNQITAEECPIGFVYNRVTQMCDDVNECETIEGQRTCYPYKICRNTIGSFLCEESQDAATGNLSCPPGFKYEDNTQMCIDIDECLLGYDICVREIQYCINTYGGFDCQSKQELNLYKCAAGYKFNNVTLNCEDVDECIEGIHSCDNMTNCRNSPGAYECDIQCSDGHRFDEKLKNCQDINECLEGTHDCLIEKENCINVPGSYQCHQLLKTEEDNCPPGFETNPSYTFICQDTNECESGIHTCDESEECINEIGGYRCIGESPENDSITDNTIVGSSELQSLRGLGDRNKRRQEESGLGNTLEKLSKCGKGFRPGIPTRPGEDIPCIDIDECQENICDSSHHCQNTIGSFICICRAGFYRDPMTGSCQDINECQTGQHSCLESQRCDNSIGSYSCIRITGCGTGYTLNSELGKCEDNDECLLGTHDCYRFGPEWQCKNTIGSFTCEKVPHRCPPGLMIAPNGDCRPPCPSGLAFNQRGDCIDIDECDVQENQRNPCPGRNQQCVNSLGSYQCISKIICPAGYEPDSESSRCIDIDECERNTHTCKGNQICENRGGGFVCRCPQGYKANEYGMCEDIDECLLYSNQGICASNADCYNTKGSFRCVCKEGFEQGQDNRTCADVDECTSIAGLCEQNCVNTWGSYKCSCRSGFTISEDSRTCKDLDECMIAKSENNFLCLGLCVNTLGSYQCDCPSGYKLSSDLRTCQDIDECEKPNTCRRDENCLNTRGGYRCNRISCPSGYERESDSADRCKKVMHCSERDSNCLRQPLTISRNYISFSTNVRIPSAGYIDLFTMRGPQWPSAVMHFNLKLTRGVGSVTREHFLLRRPENFQAVVALSKPLTNPQDVELELHMEVYHRGAFAGSAIAQIVIVVTKQEF